MEITILQNNIRSIKQNLIQLKNKIIKDNYEIIILQETFTKKEEEEEDKYKL